VGAYIQEGFATGTLSDAEFTECMELAFAPAVQHTEPLVTKLKRAILSADASPLRTFTAVGAGSSVTAGNQLDRSLTYEELERRASTFVNRMSFGNVRTCVQVMTTCTSRAGCLRSSVRRRVASPLRASA